jgi:hypothetical protein
MTPEIQDKEIRGVNLKQIVGYTVVVGGMLLLYSDIRSEIHTNRAETILTRDMMKEDRELRKLEIQSLKSDLKLNADLQRETQMRLNLLEYQVKQVVK